MKHAERLACKGSGPEIGTAPSFLVTAKNTCSSCETCMEHSGIADALLLLNCFIPIGRFAHTSDLMAAHASHVLASRGSLRSFRDPALHSLLLDLSRSQKQIKAVRETLRACPPPPTVMQPRMSKHSAPR